MTKSKEHTDRIIKNTEFITMEDGYVYAWMTLLNGRAGAVAASELRIIADELDRRNGRPQISKGDIK